MRYAIVRNGIVENVVVAGEGWEVPWEGVEVVALSDQDHVGPGWRFQDGQFVAGEFEPEPPPLKTTLSKYQFRRRFTLDELVKFDNPELFVQMTPQQQAIARTLTRSFDAATEIDLLDEQLQYGIQLMVQWGLLTSERAAQILDPGWHPAG